MALHKYHKENQNDIYHRNGDLENMEDVPKQEVERHDGMPTIEDMSKLLDRDKENPLEKKAGELGKFIEVIIKIGK